MGRRTDKLGPLLKKELNRTEGDPPVIIRLQDNQAMSQAVVSAISQTGVTVTGQESRAGLVFADALPEQIDDLQDLDVVEQVELDAEVEAFYGGENPFSASAGDVLPALSGESLSRQRSMSEALQQVNITPLATRGIKGDGATVAVLDTGVDGDHPALQGKVVGNIALTGGDPSDGAGHGTWVASAVAGDGPEVRGVAPESDILNVKVLNDQGIGSISNIIKGMSRAADEGADVINMSLGIPEQCGKDSAICKAIDDIVRDANIIMVGAAGNSGPGTSPSLPAQCDSAISVGSVNSAGRVSSFSSRGPVCDGEIYPILAAPGGGSNEGIVGAAPGGGTQSLRGTSMACPIVAGVVALLRSESPGITPASTGEVLRKTASQPETPDNNIGFGVIDAMGAVQQSKSEKNPVDQEPSAPQAEDGTQALTSGAVAALTLLL